MGLPVEVEKHVVYVCLFLKKRKRKRKKKKEGLVEERNQCIWWYIK